MVNTQKNLSALVNEIVIAVLVLSICWNMYKERKQSETEPNGKFIVNSMYVSVIGLIILIAYWQFGNANLSSRQTILKCVMGLSLILILSITMNSYNKISDDKPFYHNNSKMILLLLFFLAGRPYVDNSFCSQILGLRAMSRF